MNESKRQYQYLEAAVLLQHGHGKNVIYRRDLVRDILGINPQPDYGTGVPFGANFSKHLRNIAKAHGANYVKDANGKNARIEF
jgi:hypothetical protein